MAMIAQFNDEGRVHMVNVSNKQDTRRVAVAVGFIEMQDETMQIILDKRAQKGDVLAVAQIAGIMAAKKTSLFIPLCHNIPLTGIDIKFHIYKGRNTIKVESTVTTTNKTGVEIEALVAVSAACLTIYDMCKAVDREMVIKNIYLIQKTGGQSGEFKREEMLPWEK